MSNAQSNGIAFRVLGVIQRMKILSILPFYLDDYFTQVARDCACASQFCGLVGVSALDAQPASAEPISGEGGR